MRITYATKPAARAASIRFLTAAQRSALPEGITEAEFSLKANSRVFHHGQNTLFVGLGEAAKITPDTLRRAAGVAAAVLRKAGRVKINLLLDGWSQFIGEAVEGLILGEYRFEDYKTTKTAEIETATVVVAADALAAAKRTGARAEIVAEMTNLARKVANQPGNVVYPETLAERAQWHAKMFKLSCTVLDEKKLRAGKFGGILAVGQGSARPPRMIVLEHRGGPKGQKPLVFIGKAVTFDTGGISIKPAADMENMVWDKCGGCAVLGAMLAIARLGIKRNVIGLIPSAENMPSANAYRPGDIITCYDGTPVEIVNTDAEGRMLLADALGYARKNLKPEAMVDVATLTGACAIALGTAAAGLWSSEDSLRDSLLKASRAAGESLWPMPLFPEYDEAIRSEVARVKNSGGRYGGACTAAAFLKVFADTTPWAHLDVAYTAQTYKDLPWLARGATGFAVRTLVNLAAD